MATCLGIYIDKNIMKYAKITKEKTSIKIDAFGVEIYSDIKQTINKIIEETYSFKVPISVNLSEEMYNYFYMSDLLNQKDLKKAIKTEFESYCYEKKFNMNALESRYALVNDYNDKEKIKVIHVSIDKMNLNNILLNFDDHKVSTIAPLPLSIANIAEISPKENIAIINIENTTTVTLITGQKVYDVTKIDIGAGQILSEINEKENSLKKAYEICKNTTIYTMQGKELQDNENEYLSNIIPNLYQIATKANEIIEKSLVKVNKVLITGTGSVINNIDLYFEEILNNVKCEILRPFFIEDTLKINIKDYIEVNSAISLALQGLDYGVKNLNFSPEKNKLPSWITTSGKTSEGKNDFLKRINDINISNTQLAKWLTRLTITSAIMIIAYVGISVFIDMQIQNKENQIEDTKNYTSKQIANAKKDMTNINNKITEYNKLVKNLQDASSKITEKDAYKNVIPVLLCRIMKSIPKEVQLTSIENKNGKKIVINAQSNKYEQLAYFKTQLKSEGILNPTTVVSSEAVKENNIVKIVIEGELP